MSDEKARTTLYLSRDILNLARLDGINMSETVDNFLRNYLSVNSVEEIKKEISIYEDKILQLKMKEKDLLLKGISETRQNGMLNNTMESLRKTYLLRREQGQNKYADEVWITSPKNIQRCRIIGKEPMHILAELEEWYATQKD